MKKILLNFVLFICILFVSCETGEEASPSGTMVHRDIEIFPEFSSYPCDFNASKAHFIEVDILNTAGKVMNAQFFQYNGNGNYTLPPDTEEIMEGGKITVEIPKTGYFGLYIRIEMLDCDYCCNPQHSGRPIFEEIRSPVCDNQSGFVSYVDFLRCNYNGCN